MLLLLTLDVAAPLWAVTGAGRFLTYPWQLVLLAAPLLAALGGSLPALNVTLGRASLWLILAGVALLSSYPYLQPNFTTFAPPPAPVATMGLQPDLVVLQAAVVEEPAQTTRTQGVEQAASMTSTLTVTWQVLQPLPFDYSIFFQAVSTTPEGDTVLAQLDTQPFQGTAPATSWLQGTILTDTYVLVVPVQPLAGLPAEDQAVGKVRYFFGLYDWRDGSRLPVNGGLDDKLIFYGE